MIKKMYIKPEVHKIKLSFTESILANCHSSTSTIPLLGFPYRTCEQSGCFNADVP